MDIRNFREFEKAPTPFTIEEIFNLQKALLKGYIGIEKLPQYPLNIHDPQAQILLKDFSARVTEELGEAFESLEQLYQYMGTVKDGWNPPDVDPEKVLPSLYNFNEELADAIHFMVELMIYSGIGYDKLFGVEWEHIPDLFNHIKRHYVWDSMASYMPQIPVPKDQDNLFIQGGRRVSGVFRDQTIRGMWAVIYPLQLARNALKNKPWKQSQMLSDDKVYESTIKRAFIALVCLCLSVGMDEQSFYNVYLAKNKVNIFRQQSRY